MYTLRRDVTGLPSRSSTRVRTLPGLLRSAVTTFPIGAPVASSESTRRSVAPACTPSTTGVPFLATTPATVYEPFASVRSVNPTISRSRRTERRPVLHQLFDDKEFRDDQLRLIFTCCHPALPPATCVAMTLREICGPNSFVEATPENELPTGSRPSAALLHAPERAADSDRRASSSGVSRRKRRRG